MSSGGGEMEVLKSLLFGKRVITQVGLVGMATFEYREDGEICQQPLKVRQAISIRRWGLFQRLSNPYVEIPPELQTMRGVIHYDYWETRPGGGDE